MLCYNPDKFTSLYRSSLGQGIWEFLTKPETVARLVTASELGKPAVEGIEEQLLSEFREEVLADRVKQMIGHMVRQIMEQTGWVIDQSEVRVRSVPFVKATRYTRPDCSTFHAFRNAKDPRDVAITDRRQRAALPDCARWIYYVTFSSPLQASIGFGIHNLQELSEEVRRNGYKRVRVARMLRRA